ncbi:interferon-induced very large GTPase 1-like [Apostichopus japonicus]|uniref:interferon-induced very large GTPase 1-like n=1 Tax=Stichopus japonicus TaxID=307972 RepID=UPI003AB2C229
MSKMSDIELTLRGLYVNQSDRSGVVKPRGALAKLSVREGKPFEPKEISETRVFFDKQSENLFLSLCSQGYENLPNEVSTHASSDIPESVQYISKVKHTWYLAKSLERINDDCSIKLTDDAIESLQNITVCLSSSDEHATNAKANDLITDFFNTFGSHVPSGPFVVGGRSVEIIHTSDTKLEKATILRLLEEEFATTDGEEVSTSFAGGVSLKAEGKDTEFIEFHRQVQLFGGQQDECIEFIDWKKCLQMSFLVISGALSLPNTIPVWEVIKTQQGNLKDSNEKLRDALNNVWMATNSSTDDTEKEQDVGSHTYETASDDDSISPQESTNQSHCVRTNSTELPELFAKLGLTGEHHGFCEALVLRKGVMQDANFGQDVFWNYVRYISSLDYRGRKCLELPADVSSQGTSGGVQLEGDIFDDDDDESGNSTKDNPSVISSLDVTHGILHCCDAFLRQELLWKMAECRLAVPVLLPGLRNGERIQFLLWGLRKIYKSWRPRNEISPVERSMITQALPIVTFMRFGNANISKSKLLNKVMGTLQGNNDHPYFVDKEEEFPCAKWSKGTLEAAWFLPETVSEQRGGIALKDAITFFNLRGDALTYKLLQQRDFACKAADVVVLLVDDLSYETCRDEMRKISQMVGKHLICIVCRRSSPSSNEASIKRQGKVTKIFSKRFLKDVGKDICKELNQILWPEDDQKKLPACTKSIESLVNLCESLNIEVDENNESCVKGKKLAKDIIRSVRGNPELYKQTHLPLQEVQWKEWAALDKRWNKGYRPNREFRTIEHYHDDLKDKMSTLREEQLRTKPGKDILQFIEAVRGTPESSQYFISWLNFYMNDLSQETLGPLRKELRQIQDKARETNAERSKLNDKSEKSDDEEKKLNALTNTDHDLLVKAQKITKKLDGVSLGLEHFLRELGQHFEAHEDVKLQAGTDVDTFMKPDLLPEVAANLLMNGYPLEILDGDVGRVPIKWVQAVFKVVASRLKNALVCAISVLGIQSSGKSTLLNSMFGVRFAVSAGRCTRGVFIQLLKVHEDLRDEANCDYIIIIDTEGLKAPDRSLRDDFRHDNELATFALCLADVTIINIAGQTVGKDMTDVLQIAAHAFIRMKEVHIKSICRIIQQFVADLSAEDKNEACTQSILNNLDEAIAAAAKEEGYENLYTRFSDVFNLKRNDEVQYIPSLWQGSMAPPNHRYSEKILKLKQIIVRDLKLSTRSIEQFMKRTTDVWNAVKEENFIFSFQNCVVALRYKTFQHAYGKWVGEMRQEIMEWESDAKQTLKNASKNEIDDTKKDLKLRVKTVVAEACDKVEHRILEYLQDNLKDDEDQLHKFENEFLQDLEVTGRNVEQDAQDVLERVADSIKELNHMDVLLPKCKNQLRDKARKQAVELRTKHSSAQSLETVVSTKEIDEKFDELWECWIKEICDKHPTREVTFEEIESELGSYIFQQGQKKDLSKGLKKKLGVSWKGKVVSRAKGLIYGNQEDIVSTIVENSLTLLQLDIDNDLAFDLAIMKKFVDHTIDALNQKYQETALTQDIKVNAIVDAYDRAVPMIRKGRNEYNMKYSLRELLMLERDSLKEDFRALCSNAFQDKRASENVANLFVEKIVELIRNNLGPAIYGAVRQGCPYFASKFALFGNVLEDMAKKEAFDPYYKFFFDLDSFLENWSLTRIAEVCTDGNPDGTSNIQRLVSIKLEDISRELLRSIRKTVEIIFGNDSVVESCKTFSEWILYLRIELQTNLPSLHLSDEDVGNLYMFQIEDLKFFGDQVIESVNDMECQILEQLKLPEEGQTGDAMKFLCSLPTKPHYEIKKHVSGCMEQCPMCHVPCDNMTKKHEIHRAELHYPEGVVGCASKKDMRLSCAICTSSVTTSDTYWDGQQMRYYCDYQKDFPNWVIQPIQNDSPLKYWKWVMNRFNEDFATMYGHKEAKLPQGWVEITKDDAIQDLRQAYTTRQAT